MDKIQPLWDRVLVKIDEPEKETKSGLVLPDTIGKERPQQGVVVATGHGKVNDVGIATPMSVYEGDIVIFPKYGPDELILDGVRYCIISEANILAVIKK